MYQFTQFISRGKAEKINFQSTSSIIISISTPPVPVNVKTDSVNAGPCYPAQLVESSWRDILRLEFHDSEPSATDLYRVYFNETHAVEVIKFLEKHANTEVKNVIVHCDAGVSRSAAISKFTALTYGLPFNENYRQYNKFVFSTLLKTTGQIPRGAEDSAFSQGL